MDGKLLEGSDVKLSCKSSDGSDPIHYKWERVLDKGKSLGKLPNLALIGKERAHGRSPSQVREHFHTPPSFSRGCFDGRKVQKLPLAKDL